MQLQWNFRSGTVSVPAAAAKSADSASRTELAVLLILCAEPDILDDLDSRLDRIAERADCTPDEVRAAIQFWRGAGVLKYSRTKTAKEAVSAGTPDGAEPTQAPSSEAAKPPHLQSTDEHTYSGEEVARLLSENDGSRRKLIEECQTISGKIFNTLEINKILYLSDHLRLENEYILLLFTYCKNRGKTSVHYIERVALNLYDEGCDDLAKLEAYIRQKEEAESYEGQIRTLFGIGGRALSKKEKGFLTLWRTAYRMSAEMVSAAYNICIDRKGELSFAYINSILERWAGQGILTPEAAEAEQQAYKAQKDQKNAAGSSFDTEEFVDLALRRSRKIANDLK